MTIWAFFAAVTYAFGALSLAMSGAWLIWLRTRNSGWVDTTWTFALSLISTFRSTGRGRIFRTCRAGRNVCHAVGSPPRLAHRRSHDGITDDPRYANLISGWRADAVRQMFWLLQKTGMGEHSVGSVHLACGLESCGARPPPASKIYSVHSSSLQRSGAKASPMSSSRNFARTRLIGPASATRGYGASRGIQTISSSGLVGSPTPS